MKSVLNKIRNKLSFNSEAIAFRFNKLVCSVCLGLDIPIPVRLRDFYIVENYYQALQLYHPGEYPGRLVIFKSGERSDRDPQLGWGEVAKGGIRVHDIPGSHMSIINDDKSAAHLSEKLAAEISLAETEYQ